MHRALITGTAFAVMSVGIGATVFRPEVAQAARAVSHVVVTNDSSHPVPTREQNLDANGNIKVHEQGTANVSVTNSSLPVTGTVNVGNLPGTQKVSGTVDVGNIPATQDVAGTVNVGNLPAVEQVAGSVSSADQTSILANTTVSGQGSNSVELIDSANVSSAREVRLSIWCSGSSSCSNVGVDIWADGNYLLDQFQMQGSGYSTSFVSKSYDIPGRSLSAIVVNNNSSMTFTVEIVGRSN